MTNRLNKIAKNKKRTPILSFYFVYDSIDSFCVCYHSVWCHKHQPLHDRWTMGWENVKGYSFFFIWDQRAVTFYVGKKVEIKNKLNLFLSNLFNVSLFYTMSFILKK